MKRMILKQKASYLAHLIHASWTSPLSEGVLTKEAIAVMVMEAFDDQTEPLLEEEQDAGQTEEN